jgi:membrane-anchored protein YejM (alkaline phosphatase superfamily)
MNKVNGSDANPKELPSSGAPTRLPVPLNQRDSTNKSTHLIELKPKVYRSRREKVIDFLIGSALFIVLNAIMFGFYHIYSNWSSAIYTNPLYAAVNIMGIVIPLTFNVALIVFLAFTRSWMSLGMLWTIVFILVMIPICFTLLIMTIGL